MGDDLVAVRPRNQKHWSSLLGAVWNFGAFASSNAAHLE